jgi:mono/diheme cytochrome c family protein
MNVRLLLLRPTAAVALLVMSAGAVAAAPPAEPALPAKPAAKPDAAGVEFFERKVRPVLAEHCYTCHSARAEKLKGNLYLDSREGMLKGGDAGPAVLSGVPGKSPLVKAVRWDDQDTKMPPKTQLPPQVVADLTRWVQMGAPWPAEPKVAAATATTAKPGHTPDQQTQDQKWASSSEGTGRGSR